jgi:D-alanyl-lipoteichoic acid acyltransferase DltB (MBOAT superfamily)
MEIISLEFLIAAIASSLIYYWINPRYRVGYLSLLGCIFIISYNYLLLPYILLYTAANYYIGLKLPDSRNKIALYRAGLILNLTQLIFLRYASFTLDPLLQLFNSNIRISKISEILVPLGISYFTLQGIGYLINVKMGWEKPETRFIDFFLYITFFPKFLSGPIERSNHFLPQLKKAQFFDQKEVTEGLRTVLFGFFKKVAIANQLAPYVFDTFHDIDSVNGFSLVVLFFLLPIYLYFDFSGYTDIAIGVARLFGVKLLPNFNRPFFSENMTNFWRRFHMSLSLWFNDYIFKQVSFRRRKWGVFAPVYAVFLTWILFGIWHGAGWNFMILGVLQAVAIYYEFFTKKIRAKIFSRIPRVLGLWIGRVTVYVFYCISMVFFFSPDLEIIGAFFSKLFSVSGPVVIDDLSTKPFSLIIYVPVFLFLELLQNDYSKVYERIYNFWNSEKWVNIVCRWIVYSIMITIIFIVGLKTEQFVYANF